MTAFKKFTSQPSPNIPADNQNAIINTLDLGNAQNSNGSLGNELSILYMLYKECIKKAGPLMDDYLHS